MSTRLGSYLRDHLAGARFAIELLETMRDQHDAAPLGRLAAELLAEIDEDRQTLQEIADRVGEGPSVLKEAGSWLMEKFVPLKLRAGSDAPFTDYLSVEALALGVLGKLALWRALSVIAPADARLGGVDWQRLIERAQSQHERLETYRLQLAAETLTA